MTRIFPIRQSLGLALVLLSGLALLFLTACQCNKEAPAPAAPVAEAPVAVAPAPVGEAPAPALAPATPPAPLEDWLVLVTETKTGSDTGKPTRQFTASEKEGVVTLMGAAVEDQAHAQRLSTLVKGADWADISGYDAGELAEDPVYDFVVTIKGRPYEFRRNRLDGSPIEVLRLLQFFLN